MDMINENCKLGKIERGRKELLKLILLGVGKVEK